MARLSRRMYPMTPWFPIAISSCCAGEAAHERHGDPSVAFRTYHPWLGVARYSGRRRTDGPLFVGLQRGPAVCGETAQRHAYAASPVQRHLPCVSLAVSEGPHAARAVSGLA